VLALQERFTTFLIVPTDGSFLERTTLRDKDGNQFHIEQKIEVKGIVFHKKPNLKKLKGNDGVIFNSHTFKNGASNWKEQYCIFPPGFPIKNQNIIKTILKKSRVHSYEYEDHGWELIEECRIIPGSFEVQEVPVNRLEFVTEEISGGCTVLTKRDFDGYRRNGMPQSVYDDLLGENDFSGPFLSEHSTLTVNGTNIEDFYRKLEGLYNESRNSNSETNFTEPSSKELNNQSNKAAKKQTTGSNPHMFVHSEWTKGSYYELTIYEPFDINRLRVVVSVDRLPPKSDPYCTFMLYYESQDGDMLEFNFIMNHGSNADSADLYNTKGKSVSFEILEDEEDNEDEQDVEE